MFNFILKKKYIFFSETNSQEITENFADTFDVCTQTEEKYGKELSIQCDFLNCKCAETGGGMTISEIVCAAIVEDVIKTVTELEDPTKYTENVAKDLKNLDLSSNDTQTEGSRPSRSRKNKNINDSLPFNSLLIHEEFSNPGFLRVDHKDLINSLPSENKNKKNLMSPHLEDDLQMLSSTKPGDNLQESGSPESGVDSQTSCSPKSGENLKISSPSLKRNNDARSKPLQKVKTPQTKSSEKVHNCQTS